MNREATMELMIFGAGDIGSAIAKRFEGFDTYTIGVCRNVEKQRPFFDELLKCGHLWGAALDVTNPEPLPKDHPLWSNPRCMITPHASGATFEHLEATEDLLCEIVCDNISRYCNGEEIKNRIY